MVLGEPGVSPAAATSHGALPTGADLVLGKVSHLVFVFTQSSEGGGSSVCVCIRLCVFNHSYASRQSLERSLQ